MKKFLSIIVFLLVIITSSNLSSAYERNKYDNSPHYIFVTTSQGQIYLDLRTVNVHDYNPPYYQIAGEFIWVNGDKENRFELVIRYNFDTKETYVRRDGYWTKSEVNGDGNYKTNNRKFADALFSTAYGMDFYGSSFKDSIAEYSSNKDVQKYTEQIKQNPNDASAYNNRGEAYRKSGNYSQAIEDYNKAIELNPNESKYYNNRGIAYLCKNQFDTAIKDSTKAIQLNSNDPDYYTNRGNAYYLLKQYELAIKDYSKAIKLNPNEVAYYNNRGNAFDDLGKYKNAIKDYNKAIELNPHFAPAYYNRGLVYKKIGKNKEAKEDFKKSKQLGYK